MGNSNFKIKKKYPNKKIYQIGETFGSRELIGRYISSGKLDGQFDFNLYFDMRNVFITESSFKILNNSLLNTFSYYGDFSLMGNITGNHDIQDLYPMLQTHCHLKKMKKLDGIEI